MIFVVDPALVQGHGIDPGEQLAPFVFDGVIGREHDQPDRSTTGDAVIEFIGKVFNQPGFGPIRIKPTFFVDCFAGCLAHNSFSAARFSRHFIIK